MNYIDLIILTHLLLNYTYFKMYINNNYGIKICGIALSFSKY